MDCHGNVFTRADETLVHITILFPQFVTISITVSLTLNILQLPLQKWFSQTRQGHVLTLTRILYATPANNAFHFHVLRRCVCVCLYMWQCTRETCEYDVCVLGKRASHSFPSIQYEQESYFCITLLRFLFKKTQTKTLFIGTLQPLDEQFSHLFRLYSDEVEIMMIDASNIKPRASRSSCEFAPAVTLVFTNFVVCVSRAFSACMILYSYRKKRVQMCTFSPGEGLVIKAQQLPQRGRQAG